MRKFGLGCFVFLKRAKNIKDASRSLHSMSIDCKIVSENVKKVLMDRSKKRRILKNTASIFLAVGITQLIPWIAPPSDGERIGAIVLAALGLLIFLGLRLSRTSA
jgi:hypothetical protein